MAETEYMQLGRIRSSSRRAFGAVQPRISVNYWNPPRTTPQYPQNLLRQTTMNGLRGLGALNDAVEYPIGSAIGFTMLSLASGIASAYHGSRRYPRRVWPAVGWGVMGMIFPVITPVVAVAQGYGKPRRGRR